MCVCVNVYVATYILCALHVCMSACMYVMRVYERVIRNECHTQKIEMAASLFFLRG